MMFTKQDVRTMCKKAKASPHRYVGSGCFKQCWKVRYKGKAYALKLHSDEHSAREELRISNECHDHVVPTLCAMRIRGRWYTVMPWAGDRPTDEEFEEFEAWGERDLSEAGFWDRHPGNVRYWKGRWRMIDYAN